MITILDYGLGNPESVSNMIRRLGVNAVISSDKDKIEQAKLLIIPGVGHFARAMENLKSMDLLDILNHKALVQKTPVLGICLGMQLFFEHSEEGNVDGLGWIPGVVKKFNLVHPDMKIPHMGWTEVICQNNSPLFIDQEEPLRYYFVHSYHVVCDQNQHAIASANYGYSFTCAARKDNITGVQFHPEKSHLYGFRFFQRYFKFISL